MLVLGSRADAGLDCVVSIGGSQASVRRSSSQAPELRPSSAFGNHDLAPIFPSQELMDEVAVWLELKLGVLR